MMSIYEFDSDEIMKGGSDYDDDHDLTYGGAPPKAKKTMSKKTKSKNTKSKKTMSKNTKSKKMTSRSSKPIVRVKQKPMKMNTLAKMDIDDEFIKFAKHYSLTNLPPSQYEVEEMAKSKIGKSAISETQNMIQQIDKQTDHLINYTHQDYEINYDINPLFDKYKNPVYVPEGHDGLATMIKSDDLPYPITNDANTVKETLIQSYANLLRSVDTDRFFNS